MKTTDAGTGAPPPNSTLLQQWWWPFRERGIWLLKELPCKGTSYAHITLWVQEPLTENKALLSCLAFAPDPQTPQFFIGAQFRCHHYCQLAPAWVPLSCRFC